MSTVEGAPADRPPAPVVPLGRPHAAWLVAWGLAVVCGLGVLAAGYAVDLPGWAARIASGVVVSAAAAALSWRSGGRPWAATTLVGVLAAVTAAFPADVLLSGASVGTAIILAVLALLVTQPATTFVRTVVEVLLAVGVATVGGLAVTGWGADLNHDRYDYVVLGGALIAAGVLVYRLAAGFHGLGKRGYVVALTALLMIAIALAYTEALARWGPDGFLRQVQDFRFAVRDLLGAVPHPLETLLGIPAIAWGVFMRARRRQGWWVCAFGAAATAPATERFMEHGLAVQGRVLGAVYTVVLGLVIAFVVIRVEQWFTGGRSARGRRVEAAEAVRPEPSRLFPLN